MKMLHSSLRAPALRRSLVMWCCVAGTALAAPDEEALGKAQGYPVAPRAALATTDAYRVGSFSAMDSLAPHCTLPASPQPLELPAAVVDAQPLRYRFRGQDHTLDDYLQHQRVTGLLVVKDGTLVAERYGYERTAAHRMLSNSMAKTIVALAMGVALEEGRIRSLEDTAATYEPALAGSLYGETRLVDLLRMASGARFVEDYSGHDDFARLRETTRTQGTVAALRQVRERDHPAGTRFHYASAETGVLGLVLRAATGRSLCDFVAEKLWQPLGAQAAASWLLNQRDGVEMAAGGFNATARDYARLGVLLANDGQREGRSIVPREWLLRMTEAARQPEQFRSGTLEHAGSRYFGYGFQTWLLPGKARRFVLLGTYGQAIYVDPALRLVMVHLAVDGAASGGASASRMPSERDALWRGVVARFGRWE